MLYRQYKYKFYLNLNHSIRIDGKQGAVHPHTWEISMDIISTDKVFTQFSQIEKRMEKLLEKYQDRYINEIPPFDTINPTLENACEFFLELIQKDIKDTGWILLMIEISETPSRSYMINVIETS